MALPAVELNMLWTTLGHTFLSYTFVRFIQVSHIWCLPAHQTVGHSFHLSCGTKQAQDVFIFPPIWFMILPRYSDSPAIYSTLEGKEKATNREIIRRLCVRCSLLQEQETQINWSHYLIYLIDLGCIEGVMTASHSLRAEQFNYIYWFPVSHAVHW